jgi:hypothetical protein
MYGFRWPTIGMEALRQGAIACNNPYWALTIPTIANCWFYFEQDGKVGT